MKNLLTATLLLTGLSCGLTTSSATAGDHIDDLAFSLQKQTQALNYEFSRNYRHAPCYRHLMSDTAQMYRLAVHIHDVAHHGGNEEHLEADVRQIDKLFHHIEELVAEMANHHHDDYHYGHPGLAPLHGHGYHGHYQGPDTRRALLLMESIEDTIHHLHADLQRIIQHHHTPAPVVPTRPQYPSQNYQSYPSYPTQNYQTYPGYPSQNYQAYPGYPSQTYETYPSYPTQNYQTYPRQQNVYPGTPGVYYSR